jgi:hypothetical protein
MVVRVVRLVRLVRVVVPPQNSVRKKSFGRTFSFSNCHILGLDTGSLVLIVFVSRAHCYLAHTPKSVSFSASLLLLS